VLNKDLRDQRPCPGEHIIATNGGKKGPAGRDPHSRAGTRGFLVKRDLFRSKNKKVVSISIR